MRNTTGLESDFGQLKIDYSIPASSLTVNRTKKLGDGGFGIVYLGEYNFAPVAVKELKVSASMLSAETLQEFRRETELMVSLRSPYVIQVMGACVDSTSPYQLVMEYAPRGSLYGVLRQQALTWPQQHKIASEVSYGLHYLHGKNVIHRDLKSLNVLIMNDLQAKITDFGLAKVKKETGSKSTTAHNAVGSLLWMAPELFGRRPSYNAATDVFALAVVFWELASRKLPFEDAPNAQVAGMWVMQGQREDIPEDTPEFFAHLIGQCWVQEASSRPALSSVITTLRANAPALASAASASSSVSPAGVSSSGLSTLGGSRFNYASAGGGQATGAGGSSDSLSGLSYQSAASAASSSGANTGRFDTLGTIIYSGSSVDANHSISAGGRPDSLSGLTYQSTAPSSRAGGGADNASSRLSERTQTFHPLKASARELEQRLDSTQLLHHIVRGDIEAVEKILSDRNNAELLLVKSRFKDLSKSQREFNASALQYVYWARDAAMFSLLLDHADKSLAKEQLEELRHHPNRVSRYGSRHSLNRLIEVSQAYLDNYSKWGSSQREKYWCETVGGEQADCPAWYWYVWYEKGYQTYWTLQDPTRGFKRDPAAAEWFTKHRDNGGLIGDQWAALRGDGPRVGCRLRPCVLHGVRVVIVVCHDIGVHTQSDRHATESLDNLATTKLPSMIPQC